MPSDITGTEVLQEDRSTGARQLHYVPGPIFANVVLRRRDQPHSAQDPGGALGIDARAACVSRRAIVIRSPDPFFVLATQNPIEQEGTYPLPEAQLDRFLFKVFVGYPTPDEERKIYRLTTGGQAPTVTKVLSGEEIPSLASDRPPRADLGPLPRLCNGAGSQHAIGRAGASSFAGKWIAWGAGPARRPGIGPHLEGTRRARGALERHDRGYSRRSSSGFASSASNDLCRAGRRAHCRFNHWEVTRRNTCPPRSRRRRWPSRPRIPILRSWPGLPAYRCARGMWSKGPSPACTAAPSMGSMSSSRNIANTRPVTNLRRLDWRVLGRTDRYYVKQFEEESNLRATLVIDASASMRYAQGR